MGEHDRSAGEQGVYTPNFEFFYRDVIHEHNWPGYDALGFAPVPPDLGEVVWPKAYGPIPRWLRSEYGIYNIYTGDVWHSAANGPVRNGQDVGLYVSPAGLEHSADFPRPHMGDFAHQLGEITPEEFVERLVKRNADAIHQDNWPEYAARGFMPIVEPEHVDVRWLLGLTNFYTGDPWDEETRGPSPVGSGTMLYTSPEGLWHMANMLRKDRANQRQIRQIQEQFGDVPPR